MGNWQGNSPYETSGIANPSLGIQMQVSDWCTKTSNFNFLLPSVYSPRLLTSRVLLWKLANPTCCGYLINTPSFLVASRGRCHFIRVKTHLPDTSFLGCLSVCIFFFLLPPLPIQGTGTQAARDIVICYISVCQRLVYLVPESS